MYSLIKEYTEMLTEYRDESIKRLVAESEGLGEDAVINLRFTTSQMMAGSAELLAYGTAVTLRR
jgi:uncharacterized protein YbjQ (UPF0145 family)